EAGLVGALGLAVAVDTPARHQRAMANLYIAEIALRISFAIAAIRPGDLHAAAGHDEAVQLEPAALLAGDRKRVGARSHVVQETDHGPPAIRRAHLQVLAR